MDKQLKRYILIEAVIAFFANALINGLIAWLLHMKKSAVPVDIVSLAVDIGITALLIGMLNAMSAASSLKKHRAAGVLIPPNRFWAWTGRAMKRPAALGLLEGALAILIFFPASAGLFALIRTDSLSLTGYIFYKAAYTGLLAFGIIAFSIRAGLYGPARDGQKQI